MSFLVMDNEFNRKWNAELIGLRFQIPPSYCCVIELDEKPDYNNVQEYRNGLAKKAI